MRKIILISIVIALLYSCNSQSPKTDDANKKHDYSLNPELFIEEAEAELSKYPKNQDEIIIESINHYQKIVDNTNELNYSKIQNNPDSYKKYFSYTMSEGEYYLIPKPSVFLKLNEFVEGKNKAFLQAYSLEFEEIAVNDAAIMISDNELINRAYLWGELTSSIINEELNKLSVEKYRYYLYLIYFGTDNTPSFGFSDGKFNKERYNLMLKLSSESPDAVIAESFMEFCSLLEKSDFIKSNDISNFKI